MGWRDIPSAEERFRIKTVLIIFSTKEFVPEGKAVNAEFYKGVIDFLKCIQWVHTAVFCCQDLFLLHNNAPAHKAASVPIFDKKKLQPFIILVLSRFISARLFSVPQVEN